MYRCFPKELRSEKPLCYPWSTQQKFHHRKSKFSTCIIELVFSHNRLERRETEGWTFILLIEENKGVSLNVLRAVYTRTFLFDFV